LRPDHGHVTVDALGLAVGRVVGGFARRLRGRSGLDVSAANPNNFAMVPMSEPCVVIPARLAATRLPGKPLRSLGGIPLVEHVRRRCRHAGFRAVVATPDPEIAASVRTFGGEVAMTLAQARSGTERVALAQIDAERILNVQGDQPLVDAAHLRLVAGALDRAGITTLARPWPSVGPPPSPTALVKVVRDAAGRALYFSRSLIPARGPWLVHVGIYGFDAETLQRVVSLPRRGLADSEDLEQLDWLEAGERIVVLDTDADPGAVDTPEQLAALEARFASGELQVPAQIA
jgi:3-deoxy-manno-octulosonate cytidylyltransferase (CMP-KDO synthetase)